MSVTACLRDEHRVILGVLECLEIALQRAGQSGAVTREVFGPFVEFFQGFTDRCHHCKEEDRLFPCLERCGVSREGGPIGVMLYEHQLGRAHVRAMAEAIAAAEGGDRNAGRAVLREGGALLDLLRDHIAKEDRVLFEIADHVVHAGEEAALERSYAEAESEAAYAETFTRCRRLARGLMARYAVEQPMP